MTNFNFIVSYDSKTQSVDLLDERDGKDVFYALVAEPLGNALAEDRLRYFVGAGVSAQAGYPPWSELACRVAQNLGLTRNFEDVPEVLVLQHAFDTFMQSRPELDAREAKRKFVIEHVRPSFEKLQKANDAIIPEPLRLMTRSPASEIWTTNFDSLIETALGAAHAHVVRKHDLSDYPSESQLALRAAMTKRVYKVHGDLHTPESIVLTQSDYDSFRHERRLFSDLLLASMICNVFLFVGYSFIDDNIRLLRRILSRRAGNSLRKSYGLFVRPEKNAAESCDEHSAARTKKELTEAHLSTLGISTLNIEFRCSDGSDHKQAREEVTSWFVRKLNSIAMQSPRLTIRWSLQTSAEVGKAIVQEGASRLAEQGVGHGVAIKKMLANVPFLYEYLNSPGNFIDYESIQQMYQNLDAANDCRPELTFEPGNEITTAHAKDCPALAAGMRAGRSLFRLDRSDFDACRSPLTAIMADSSSIFTDRLGSKEERIALMLYEPSFYLHFYTWILRLELVSPASAALAAITRLGARHCCTYELNADFAGRDISWMIGRQTCLFTKGLALYIADQAVEEGASVAIEHECNHDFGYSRDKTTARLCRFSVVW